MMLLLAASTGMRSGELGGLKWVFSRRVRF
jgi:integrase